MAAVRSLNDDEVFNEMKKMVAFIKQEALEKAREIKVKADEEFNIEKAKIVRQESLNIEAVFERKIKQAEVQKRIAQSNHVNKARLRMLQKREEVLEDIFNEAHSQILDVPKDSDKYNTFLENSILEAAYTLMETEETTTTEIALECREEDVEKVKAVVPQAIKTFEETLNRKLTIHVSDSYLPSSSAGGVIATALKGAIIVNNTLEARLDTCKEGMLPQIRVLLFGHSSSRKFFD